MITAIVAWIESKSTLEFNGLYIATFLIDIAMLEGLFEVLTK